MNDDQIEREIVALSRAISPTAEAPLVLHRALGRRVRRRRITAVTASVACLMVVVGAAWAATSDSPRDSPVATVAIPSARIEASEGPIIYGDALERFDSSTAEDWSSLADHAVVGTVKSETEQPPTESEIDRGEGLIGRTATISVEQTVWSRTDAPSIPAVITLPAAGSTFEGGVGENRTRMAFRDASRLEVGHRYVFALYFRSSSCDEADTSAGRWAGIGSGGIIPFDSGILGTGEFEGRSNVTVPDAKAGSGVLRAQIRGKSLADLRAALHAAKAGVRRSVLSSTC